MGHKLISFCKSMQLFICNGRVGNDMKDRRVRCLVVLSVISIGVPLCYIYIERVRGIEMPKLSMPCDVPDVEVENVNPDNITDANAIAKFQKYVLNETMATLVYRCLDVFQEVADDLNMTWWISAGTLLGSYRHHAMIPWDQDIDVMAPSAMKDKFRSSFQKRNANGEFKGFALYTKLRWDKIYPLEGVNKRGYSWLSPYVDIFWYSDNGTHITAMFETTQSWTTILPLSPRPLGNKTYPAPHDPRGYLCRSYGIKWRKICISGWYHHMEDWIKPKEDVISVKCASLHNSYPFVRHSIGPDGSYCKEDLMFRGRVLNSFVRSAENINLC